MRKTRTSAVLMGVVLTLICGEAAAGMGWSAILNKTNKDIIPATVVELDRNGWTVDARRWENATAGDGHPVWAYADTSQKLMPSYWLVSVRKGNELVGAVALSPEDGSLAWRATRFLPQQKALAEALFGSTKDAAKERLNDRAKGEEAKRLMLDKIVMFSMNGRYYWLCPLDGEPLAQSLLLPVEPNKEAIRFWEGEKRGRGVYPAKVVVEDEKELSQAGSASFKVPEKEVNVDSHVGTTWLVNEVPLYFQQATENCWAFSAVAIYQWWSPVVLGQGWALTEMLRLWTGKDTQTGNDQFSMATLFKSWDKIDEHWDVNGASANAWEAEDWLTVWQGVGLSFVEGAEPSWVSKDPKTWIAWEAPLYVSIDSDGAGPGASTDHAVVLTGYCPVANMVYINNPNGFQDAFSYDSWNTNYWGAHWAHACHWFFCYETIYWRRGMIAALPGDRVAPPAPLPVFAAPSVILDGAKAAITQIGVILDGAGSEAFAGTDSWGDVYRTECLVTVPAGNPGGGQKSGDFDAASVASFNDGVRGKFEKHTTTPGGVALTGGEFLLNFGAPQVQTAQMVDAECAVNDTADRSHFQFSQKIEVWDDRGGLNGKMMMHRPLRVASIGKHSQVVKSMDDDSGPPTVQLISTEEVTDAEPGAYRFEVDIVDSSGLSEVLAKWGFASQDAGEFQPFEGHQGSRYWLDVPRTQWVKQVGSSMNFRVRAQDNDSDYEGDQSSADSDFMIDIVDDDTAGPVLITHGLEKGPAADMMKVKVRLHDDSGVASGGGFPKIVYGFKSNFKLEESAGSAVLIPIPGQPAGWFEAMVPWGGLKCHSHGGVKSLTAAGKSKKIYLRVHSQDADADRPSDQAEALSPAWSETYCPGRSLLGGKPLVDITPQKGIRAGVNVAASVKTGPPKELPPEVTNEGPPDKGGPGPFPERMGARDTFAAVPVSVGSDEAGQPRVLRFKGRADKAGSYKLQIGVKSKDGVRILGTILVGGGRGAQTHALGIPAGTLQPGENTLVLLPGPGTKAGAELVLESITVR